MSSATTTAGEIIDTSNFNICEFIVQTGTITTGTSYTTILEEGDDSGLSDAAAVSVEETLGSAVFVITDDDTTKRIGYIGKKRYVRMSIVSVGTVSGVMGAAVLLAAGMHNPQANQ
ncbi:MAG: hypothetical protein GY834_01850 [Bacteroidetes bacterium]|nr:hypothetical protein [Bacteroidota bacterium]